MKSFISMFLKFWRGQEDLTGYKAGELYQSSQDGSIFKLWIPLPWWNKNGYFEVLEVCFIQVKNLTQDMKAIKMEEAAELQFFAPNRVHAWNIFFVYDARAKVKAHFQNNGYVYLIKNDDHALRHILRFVIRALESINASVKKGFVKSVAAEVLAASEEFILASNELKQEEIRKINEAG